MGADAAVPESHKAPLLLASMGLSSSLESTVAALRLKDATELTWETVTADLIQEWKRSKEGENTKSTYQTTNQARESLRNLHSKRATSSKSKKMHFRIYSFNALGKQSEENFFYRKILDSGASVSMFKSTQETLKGTYTEGLIDTIQLAAESLNDTLVSVGQICDQEHITVFTAKEAVILKITTFSVSSEDVVSIVPRERSTGLYVFTDNENEIMKTADNKSALRATAVPDSINLWHNRLVHLSESNLKSLYKHAVNFPRMKGQLELCHPCRLGRATKKQFGSKFMDATYAGEIVHSDIT
eukprot:IDg2619t1